MNENGKFRKRNGYTTTGNTLTRDHSVSLKAKGLYLVIMSYITMPDIELTKSFIFKQCKEGEKSFESSWNELKDAGYLKVYFIPTSKGWQTEYELLDEPAEGPHTFYLGSDGTIKSTNIDRKMKKSSSESDFSKEDSEKKASMNSTERTPHFGSNAKGSNAFGTNAKGSNAFGGNNISTSYNPNDNPINNLSINPVSNQMDGQMEQKISDEIKDLAEWDAYSDNSEYSDMEQSVHNLVIECLVEMCTDSNEQRYSGLSVTRERVLERIRECAAQGTGALHFFIELTMEDYINYASHNEIKDIKKYLKTCIWNAFGTYRVKWESFVRRTSMDQPPNRQ